MAQNEAHYTPKDAVTDSMKSALISGTAGLTMSAVQSSLAKTNIGTLAVFTRGGANIGYFALMGGVYEFSKSASANLRERDDVYNTSIGACLGGAVIGLRFRTFPAVIGTGVLCSVLLSTLEYTGGSLRGFERDLNIDEFERKQELRKNRRRPIQETIDELGEGRGIYGPGYDERRRARIKAAYGIDVPSKA